MNKVISTHSFSVPEAAEGCSIIGITRSQSGTNLYVTKVEITGERTPATFGYDKDEVTIALGNKDSFKAPVLSNPNNVAVTYSSSEPTVATIDAEGKVEILGVGTTVITATPAEGEASSYTLNIISSYTISFAKPNDIEGNLPEGGVVDGGTEYTLPHGYFLTKTGYSLTAWNDGNADHKVGEKYIVNSNVTFTAVFTENTVKLGDAETSVNWTFDKTKGPVLNFEGKKAYYAQIATINDETIDVPMFINTTTEAGLVDPSDESKTSKGKLNNTSQTGRAQMNRGTMLTFPAIKGMTVTITASNGTPAVGDFTFKDNSEDAEYENGTVSGMATSYTYNSDASELTLLCVTANLYPSGVIVTYPYIIPTGECGKVSSSVSDFNFNTKRYTVTFKAFPESGDDLMVSIDGADAVKMTSPAEVQPLETATAYAVAEGKTDSDPVTETVTKYDESKPYIAWVFDEKYASVSNVLDDYKAKHTLMNALGELGNVVLVPFNDLSLQVELTHLDNGCHLNKADLIVFSEAMQGGKNYSNGLKHFIGTTKIINLKFFNYTSGRWDFGTPGNPKNTKLSVIYPSNYFKVLDGVEYTEDGGIDMFTKIGDGNNCMQFVNFDKNNKPADNLIMASLAKKAGASPAPRRADAAGDDNTTENKPDYEIDNSQAAMHYSADKQLFGIGLSSDNWQDYSENAKTIVKNAASMLLNNEDLTEVNANGGPSTSLSTIEAESAPVEYFNLQGIRVAEPANGVFIRKQGTQVTKVIK